MLVSSILKLSARGFERDSDDVRKVAFSLAQTNGTGRNFSLNNKMADFAWLKLFR
jgi:hypothetical protein